ncbi:hypothetical protein [Phenylobacterium sp.]|uniref:hypothetical protein n=1 Tax=Phenylobacterium sp. TaxID=1871053 RepID=UPI002609324A|nr:hypothetical protein [Phenylobacterium sp.]
MNVVVFALCALAAGSYIAVVGALLIGWGGAFSQVQRLGLAMSASGVVLAGVPRLMGHPPGLGDLMFLAGLVTFLGRTYGPAILNSLDAMDGKSDGRLDFWRHRP